MQRKALAYLWDVHAAIAEIESFTNGLDKVQYEASSLIKSAVERQLEIIGEALAQLAKTDATVASNIPESRPAIGLRNILIHGYAMVDDAVVWHTVVNDLPTLRSTIEKLLEENKSNGSG